jgi:hypothetical protein
LQPEPFAFRLPRADDTRRDVVRRIVEQLRRVETTFLAATPAAVAGLGGDAARATALASPLRGSAAASLQRRPELTLARAPGGSDAVSGRSTDDAASSGRRTAPAPSERPTAPFDLERLTDQVVQKIDRRIVAERERVGKF